jgi:hypothetical protein
MSRTSTNKSGNKVANPVNYYISFGGDGVFSYWDKEAKQKVTLGSDVEFVVMDTRSAITGWNDDAKGRVYSNKVKSTVKEELTVRCGAATLAKGLYADIKEKVKSVGGKFCIEVFALMKIDDEFQPVQIDLSGAALGCWMSFVDELGGPWAVYAFTIKTALGEQKKKGSVKFFEVKFSTDELTSEVNEMANAFNDDMLQPYLMSVTTQSPEEAAV